MSIRLTYHEGRQGKQYTYPAKHNDRSYDFHKNKHIISEEVSADKFWDYKDGFVQPGQDIFRTHEEKFYQENFSDFLRNQNQRYRSKGKKTRTMKEYYKSQRSCPHEDLLYLGDILSHLQPDVLVDIWQKEMEWEQIMFPQIQYLNWALHVDEQSWDAETHQYIHGAPHIHARKVYLAYDKDGNLQEEMNRCLGQMGLPLPDPSKPKGRNNNPKMTYTRLCREHLQQLCLERGIDIETEPRDKSEAGRNLDEYLRRKKLKVENEKLENQQQKLNTAFESTKGKVQSYKAEQQQTIKENDNQIDQQKKAIKDNDLALESLRTESATLSKQNAAKRAEGKSLDNSIAEKKKAISTLQGKIQSYLEAIRLFNGEWKKKVKDFFKMMEDSSKEQRYRNALDKWEDPDSPKQSLLDRFDEEEEERINKADKMVTFSDEVTSSLNDVIKEDLEESKRKNNYRRKRGGPML